LFSLTNGRPQANIIWDSYDKRKTAEFRQKRCNQS
jgi:hypothetical protein